MFTRNLGVKIDFTTKIDVFIAHEGPKMSYTHKQLGNELHLRSTALLFETGVEDVVITVDVWEGIPAFFKLGDDVSALPYDIFAAAFYLLSRYEEYLPHVKDAKGRYPSGDSLAKTNNFLNVPVIDYWLLKLEALILEHFPTIGFKRQAYQSQIVIQVERAYAYRKIGFLRTVGGFFRDLSRLRLLSVFKRVQVLLGIAKDPYDTFGWILNMQKQALHPFVVFFQLGDYDGTTKNIKYSKSTFQSLIKMVGDYCKVGLYLSGRANKEEYALRVERKRLEQIVNRKLAYTLSRKRTLNLPDDFRMRIEQEVQQDFTMNYEGLLGFRAGTSKPFLFYDLDYEMQTPLRIQPICMHVEDVLAPGNTVIDTVAIDTLQQHVFEVGGVFAVSFDNTSFLDARCKNILKTIIQDDKKRRA